MLDGDLLAMLVKPLKRFSRQKDGCAVDPLVSHCSQSQHGRWRTELFLPSEGLPRVIGLDMWTTPR